MALTPKQEKFCREVASGKDYTNAYLAAYDWNGGNAGAAIEATKLANKEEIQDRIQSLMKPMEIQAQRQALTETERIKQILWEEIENARQQQDHAAVARYADQLNKLNGAYKDNTPVDNDNSLNNIDTSKLLQFVNTA
jgi:phage terminase small subunit